MTDPQNDLDRERTTPRGGKSAVPAVEKALDVLEYLSETPDGRTMNEIVDGLGRTMGEIYRVVVYLAERGYLEQDRDTGRYALTLRMFELSHRHNPTERLLRNAVPLLERIAARIDQSCHLGVLNRSTILILASVQSPRPAGYAVRTGAVFPVANTSTGNVIVAFSDPAAQKRHLARLPKAGRTVVRERLDRIIAQGFEDRESEIVAGVRNLCVPVFDSRGVVAAITSGYIDQTPQVATPEEALVQIREAAASLSRSLGHDRRSAPYAD